MLRRLTYWSILLCLLAVSGCASHNTPQTAIQVGAERVDAYLPQLQNKRVGLVVNQTSRMGQQHLVDFLIAKGIQVVQIFAPEHGFRGDHDAGAHVSNDVDPQTGVTITSIYGKNKKPAAEIMAQLDVVIFDIQDVGVRFYTYISSMHYMMEAAAENGVEFMVLDRPNPNGRFVDGPLLDAKFQSFVGMHPIPVLHGMTVAELARMIKGEGWIKQAQHLRLTTIANQHYRREMHYDLPVAPSPNLPDSQSIQLYPSLCFYEATPVSIGRGTDFPFQVIGHDQVALGEFQFSPESRPGAALHPKLEGKQLLGTDLRTSSIEGLDLALFIDSFAKFKQHNLVFFERADFMDKLAGTDQLRLAIERGQSLTDIQHSWQQDLQTFRTRRLPYLLYPDY